MYVYWIPGDQTRLAATALPGATELLLEDEVDWKADQEVVVVTTAWTDEPDSHQNEVRTLASVNGAQIALTEGLQFGHYGGPEYSAEVALLSRTITFQGDEGSEATRYGGHVMCVPGSRCRIAGASAIRMGQENVMGRYPFHLHMMGQVSGDSFFEDCLVQRSFFRAYTVHGTSNSRVSRNVAYDVSGSAYYLEDGVEEDNLFDFNLAAFVHIIDRLNDYEAGGGQEGVRVETQASRIVPTDATAVGFYCTNAKNRWIGNSASGGFSGFHFPRVEYALGDSYANNPDYRPDELELLEFDSNTAHSSGRIWSRGACMYVGGELWEDNKGSQQYRYITGRATARKSGRFFMTNTKALGSFGGFRV
ncbi:rliB [Symbiodinium natans]|uniref:RliB protein n=1 Tax=Symbiodinium natans TaxID=878477 RepID=A0A812G0V2_9DINO|nr:rliB [Symbiodinium natans]